MHVDIVISNVFNLNKLFFFFLLFSVKFQQKLLSVKFFPYELCITLYSLLYH